MGRNDLEKCLKYETNKYRLHFQQYKVIRYIGEEAKIRQTILLENILDFSNNSRPRPKRVKKKTKYSS